MSDTPTASPVVLGRLEKPGNLASIAALASSGQITIRPHELIRTTDGRVYHWTTSALEIVSAPVHHGTVADVAALDGIYLLPSCTRGVHSGDTAYVTAASCEYRVTAGVNATATWSACATRPTIPTTPSEVGADPAGTADAAVSTHNTAPDAHADIRTLVADRALIGHQHVRADMPWITEPGGALLTAESAAAQRTALGMTSWAMAPWTDGTTNDIPEGSRLYFTATRADARIAVQKAQAQGLATLDSSGKVPASQLPDSIVGQVNFKGRWDASLNVPVLPDATVSKGFYYITTVSGSYEDIEYDKGDWCISDGVTWGKVDNSDAITSFNGRGGALLSIKSDYDTFFLGISDQAYDSARFAGQLPSYYAVASHSHAQSVIDSTSGWISTALAACQPKGNYAGSASAGGDANRALYCTNTQFSGDAIFAEDITQRTHSGIYQGRPEMVTTARGWPMNGEWTHLITATHSEPSIYYSMQFAGHFFSNQFFARNTNGVGTQGWVELMHSGNYASMIGNGSLTVAKVSGLRDELDGKQPTGNYAAGVTAGGDSYTARYCSGTAEQANMLNPLSGDYNYRLGYTADGECAHHGAWGRVVMHYKPSGTTYGVRVDRADVAAELYDADFHRITNPSGATLISAVSEQTGAIVLHLPVGMVNTMVRVVGRVFEYATNSSFDFVISGYAYSVTNNWHNPTAYITGNSNIDRRFTVRFGRDSSSGKALLYIGELSTIWKYPQVFITEVQLGYDGMSEQWTSGWSIGFESTAFSNVTAMVSDCQVGYKTPNLTAFDNLAGTGVPVRTATNTWELRSGKTASVVIGGTTLNFVNGILVSYLST